MTGVALGAEAGVAVVAAMSGERRQLPCKFIVLLVSKD